MHQVDWRLYVILDPCVVPPGRALMDVAAEALDGGAGVLQLRDKSASTRELFATARSLAQLCRERGATFIVNDRLDVALASGAHGVHLGPDDLPIAQARRLAPELIVGASAGSLARALQLAAEGADYLGIGALYEARAVKRDASAPKGPEIVAEVAQSLSMPLIGIGGIDVHTAPVVASYGAAGIAVIRSVVAAESPRDAARSLLQAFNHGCHSH